jgi:hypothetical protein
VLVPAVSRGAANKLTAGVVAREAPGSARSGAVSDMVKRSLCWQLVPFAWRGINQSKGSHTQIERMRNAISERKAEMEAERAAEASAAAAGGGTQSTVPDGVSQAQLNELAAAKRRLEGKANTAMQRAAAAEARAEALAAQLAEREAELKALFGEDPEPDADDVQGGDTGGGVASEVDFGAGTRMMRRWQDAGSERAVESSGDSTDDGANAVDTQAVEGLELLEQPTGGAGTAVDAGQEAPVGSAAPATAATVEAPPAPTQQARQSPETMTKWATQLMSSWSAAAGTATPGALVPLLLPDLVVRRLSGSMCGGPFACMLHSGHCDGSHHACGIRGWFVPSHRALGRCERRAQLRPRDAVNPSNSFDMSNCAPLCRFACIATAVPACYMTSGV